ncbi:MAG: S8 family peptidase [Pseudomonadota bacterium]
MKRCKSAVLSAAVLIALGLSATATATAGGRPDLVANGLRAGVPHQQSELLIQFKAGASASDQAVVRGGLGAQKMQTVRGGGNGRGELSLFKLPAGMSVAEAVEAVSSDPSVEFAEPNWIYTHSLNSNDPQYTNGTLWGMYGASSNPANQFGSGAGVASTNNCSSVWVGVIDEGYMYTHEDLSANAGKNPGETAGNGVDDDGNGKVDDVYGWDFDGGNNSVFDGTGDDHGTHVSGTIGGVGNNSKGVSGVCHSVKLINAKFLGRNGGTTANAIAAVDYMTDLKDRHGLNMVATNNSWGGGGFSQGLKDAIDRAGAANILFIAAAGNSGDDNDAIASYPSGYTSANIIAVAALVKDGTLASYSQYGKTTVDICAPGSAITSTVPVSSKGKVVSGYSSYNGTSMATPHVSGAAALYKATHPTATAAQIKDGLMADAIPTASCNGKVVTNGRLDVSKY